MEKVYLTKYALTRGIIVVEVEVEVDKNSALLQKYIYVKSLSTGLLTRFILGQDCFLTLAEAEEKAEEMRTKKINSLNHQLKKLQKLKFEVVNL